MMPSVGMTHPQNVVLVRRKPSKCNAFEAVNYFVFHFWRDFFIGRKRQHPTGVLVLKIQCINQVTGLFWVASYHRWRLVLTAFALFIGHIVNWASTAAC